MKEMSYHDAGVDMEAGDSLIERIKPFAKKTLRQGVLAGIGGFGALFEISKTYRNPVLVSGTDGVGTKLKLAFELNMHDTIGQDLVAMSVNDILVQGAEPLFFLDYFACGKLDVDTAEKVIKGIAQGCELSDCALIGGETAEMPSMYPHGEYDLAGFAVGVVEKENIIDGKNIKSGDIILGLASSGPHSNGYSLIRKIISTVNANFDESVGDKSLKDALISPTKIYVKSILKLISQIKIQGLAHITGGGLSENIPRILAHNQQAVLSLSAWKMPEIFSWLQQKGNVNQTEMLRVFNCGIGMIIVLEEKDATKATKILESMGETVYQIGSIKNKLQDEEPSVSYIN
jgi:phosphoribosylformylglycinamidine cyclo-ligase